MTLLLSSGPAHADYIYNQTTGMGFYYNGLNGAPPSYSYARMMTTPKPPIEIPKVIHYSGDPYSGKRVRGYEDGSGVDHTYVYNSHTRTLVEE